MNVSKMSREIEYLGYNIKQVIRLNIKTVGKYPGVKIHSIRTSIFFNENEIFNKEYLTSNDDLEKDVNSAERKAKILIDNELKTPSEITTLLALGFKS